MDRIRIKQSTFFNQQGSLDFILLASALTIFVHIHFFHRRHFFIIIIIIIIISKLNSYALQIRQFTAIDTVFFLRHSFMLE